MLRTLAERLARGRSLRRRLPRDFASRPIYVSPDAALSYLKPFWTHCFADLFSAAQRFVNPGDHIWDVGGNVGVFALAAAHQAGGSGSLLAIEADPFLASLLQKTFRHAKNEDLQLQVICAAAADQIGLARFSIARRGRASNALEDVGGRSQTGGVRYVQYVPTLTLDSLLDHFPAPNVLKIDVEGAEGIVLAGATRVLAEARPLVYCEVGPSQSREVASCLRTHRYLLFDGDAEGGPEIADCVFNTLAVPEERMPIPRAP
jgi:FkbM family methyltransferase